MSSSIWIPNIWIYKARILLELLGVFLTNPHPITILGSDARGRWRHLELVSFLERQLTWKESCTNFKQLTPQALFRSINCISHDPTVLAKHPAEMFTYMS